MELQVKKKRSGLRVLIIILALIILCVAAFGLSLLLRVRMPDNALICGVDVSAMLLEDAQMCIEDKVTEYKLHLSVGDQSFVISAADLGLQFMDDRFEEAITAFDRGTDVDPWAVISIDQQKLDSYIHENFDTRHVEAVPSKVVWDDSMSLFKVIPGNPETWYDARRLAEFVRDAVATLRTEMNIPEVELHMEFFDSDQLARAQVLAERANELIDLELEYVFNPRKVELGRYVIDGHMIASFLRFDVENDLVYVDEAAVLTYVESFASDYTYFKNKDRFIAHDGARIDVKIPFQEQTVDTQALTQLIAEQITNGESGSFEVPYSGAVNFEGSYIEVSIPEQHLWVYIEGVMVLESDVVTGNESLRKKTPTGLNYVRGHLRDIYLAGDFFVNYWMCITRGGNYGFHDADGWREPEEYGGDTYISNGSGGCVNMPREKIAIMYDLVPDGTPIVIYNSYFYD